MLDVPKLPELWLQHSFHVLLVELNVLSQKLQVCAKKLRIFIT